MQRRYGAKYKTTENQALRLCVFAEKLILNTIETASFFISYF